MMFKDVLESYRRKVEEYLHTLFTADAPQKQLFDAMRYSLLAGGKRIRPILVLEFCRVCDGDMEKALPFAAAIEMVHTYSLIHDDLPCMDNDDYRRGRLTNHKVFGEANAVLAGDALLTAAFGELSKAELPSERIVKAVSLLSGCAGECGMVGGQVLDLAGEQLVLTEDEIYTVHRLKTGALISAACRLGVIAAGGSDVQLEAAGRYAEALGLAFQTRDDMLDVLGDSGKMGKKTGMDENKNTFVRLYGVGACSKLIEKETQKSMQALSVFEDSDFLKELSMKLAIREC